MPLARVSKHEIKIITSRHDFPENTDSLYVLTPLSTPILINIGLAEEYDRC